MKLSSVRPVRVAIVGTGGMAQNHVRAFQAIPHCAVVAAVDLDRERAEEFSRRHGIRHTYSGLDELLRQDVCEAVAIVTPDASHTPLSIACLRAGKHVLCEKPLAVTARDARRMVLAARRARVVSMVNFSYRSWPCIQAVAALVQGGGIGELRHVEASYYQSWLATNTWGDWRKLPAFLWRLSTRHGSTGVLGDVGVHVIDFATFPAGPIASVSCRLKTFPKAPGNRLRGYLLDANDTALINVEFRNGAVGCLQATRWATGHSNRIYLKLCGTRGAVEIDSERSTTAYRACLGADLAPGRWRTVRAESTPSVYARFVSSIRTRSPEQPDFTTGAAVQQVVDACFAAHASGRPVRLKP